MKLELNTPLKQVISLAVLAAIWGSSFILMKKGLVSFTSAQVAFYRLFAAFAVLLPMALRSLRHIELKGRRLRGLIIVALCGNILPAWLFAEAQTRIASGVAGMLNSLVPLFTVIVGAVIFNLNFKRAQLLGVLLGLIGAVFLVTTSSSSFGTDSAIIYPLLVVFATLCYAISVNTIKMVLNGLTAIQITSVTFLMIGPLAISGLWYSGFWGVAFNSEQTVLSMAYVTLLGVLGTAAALVLFNNLVQYTSPIFASTVTYLIPIVAVLWGLADDEPFTVLHLAGMSFILLGVYLIRMK